MEDGWQLVLHSRILGPSPGARNGGDPYHGGVSTRDMTAHKVILLSSKCKKCACSPSLVHKQPGHKRPEWAVDMGKLVLGSLPDQEARCVSATLLAKSFGWQKGG